MLSCGRCDYAIVDITRITLKGPIAMNPRFPDAGTIRTVLALASRAPSVHNTQPWRWLVGSESLHLYSDVEPATAQHGSRMVVI